MEVTQDADCRRIEKASLVEVSIVDRPANRNTRFLEVKTHKECEMNKDKTPDQDTNGATEASKPDPIPSQWEARIQNIESQMQAKVDTPVVKPREWTRTDSGDYRYEIKTVPLESEIVRKDYLSQESIAGAPMGTSGAWYERFEMNPFMITPVEKPVGVSFTVPSFTIDSVSNVALLNPSPSYGGALSEVNVSLKNFEARTRFSQNSISDIPTLRSRILQAYQGAFVEAIADEIYSTLKTSIKATTSGSVAQVVSGVADNVPSGSTLIDKLSAMIEAVPTKYKMGPSTPHFVVSSGVMSKLSTYLATAGSWIVSPSHFDGSRLILLGYPCVINDVVDSIAAGNVPIVFGNFELSLELGLRKSLTVEESNATLQGSISYYAQVGLELDLEAPPQQSVWSSRRNHGKQKSNNRDEIHMDEPC